MIALPSHLTKIGELPVLEALTIRLSAVQQPRDARGREQCVVLRLQCRQLLAANVCASARHHHGRIPPKDGHGATEGMETFPFLFELFVRGLGHLKDCWAGLTGAPLVYQRPSFWRSPIGQNYF